MHLCLTVECITSGLHLSVFLIRPPPPPAFICFCRCAPVPPPPPKCSNLNREFTYFIALHRVGLGLWGRMDFSPGLRVPPRRQGLCSPMAAAAAAGSRSPVPPCPPSPRHTAPVVPQPPRQQRGSPHPITKIAAPRRTRRPTTSLPRRYPQPPLRAPAPAPQSHLSLTKPHSHCDRCRRHFAPPPAFRRGHAAAAGFRRRGVAAAAGARGTVKRGPRVG